MTAAAVAKRLSRELQGCLRSSVWWNGQEGSARSLEGPAPKDPAKRYRHGVALVCFRPLGHAGRCRRRRIFVRAEEK